MDTTQPETGYPLLVIVGPTSAGKSALSLELAQRWNGEIVSFDSMQVYRGFNIGTGKLSAKEQRGIPHHLLDCVDGDQVFTAGDYSREASRILSSLRERGRLPLLVGGTGLYLRALLIGLFDGPARSETLRARLGALAERRGRHFLHRLLRRLDAPTAGRIQPRDTQKIMRAVEVCLLVRQPFSALLARGRVGLQGFQALKIGLNPDRAELDRRINARVECMFAAGLLEEARGLIAQSHSVRPSGEVCKGPFGSLGYRQAAATLRGEISTDEAVRGTQTATRRYAKRQRTWFRREPDVKWFAGFGDDPAIQRQVVDWLEATALPPGAWFQKPRLTRLSSRLSASAVKEI